MTNTNKPARTAIKITDNAKNNLFIGCKVNGGVEIDENAKDNKFIQTDITTSMSSMKKWYEKPFGILLLMIIGGFVVGYLLYYFGWN